MALILVVDDDCDVVFQNQLALEKQGHQVVSAYSAREAKKLLTERNFDILITDVIMEEETSGLNLIQFCQQHFPDLQVILLSNIFDRSLWTRYPVETWQSVVKYLFKPTSPGDLTRFVELALRFKPVLAS